VKRRKGTHREEDELLVNEVSIRNKVHILVQKRARNEGAQPLLPVIRLFLTESQLNLPPIYVKNSKKTGGRRSPNLIIIAWRGPAKRDFMLPQVLEVLLGLGGSACAQTCSTSSCCNSKDGKGQAKKTFVVLDIPTVRVSSALPFLIL
jgi:hypothetical protein